MPRPLAVAAALCVAVAVASPAPTPAIAKVSVATACRAEADKYCREPLKLKKRGSEKVLRCLEEMSPVLVEACRKLVDRMLACRADSVRFCKGRISDDGWGCVLRRGAHVSARCRAAIAPPPPPPPSVDDIGDCGQDYERFCGHVAPGEGREWACLRGRIEDLTAECRADVERR
ncbi:MAG: hypothetical protein FJ087_20880 [Deltaproteobacteria bacterium]|nr:hypothetical protein [Deltaproteobacteria bacterium]